ncbi:GlxA family transcriptional regulator [Halomonas dongshanensis]|uniref:GlxA family transcriptional regulator n=1 Tax=Halomonas dongshanensis TaxID=2890835 RepID=A0ABT2EDF4_9GAMM|nr:GlxA family transcriptional regulator [Halomonas dongshanensis]MCS2608677.1 GlxA family transcriptional regulator [Halomonas dongshanensis]
MQHAPSASSAPARQRVGILLMPGFSLLSHASLIEPLLLANQLGGQMHYQVATLGLDDTRIRSNAQLACQADYSLDNAPTEWDVVMVCAPSPLPYALPARLIEWLRQRQARAALGGLGGGTEVLARCGLLEGYRATLPWPRFEAFAQAYPGVMLSQQLFEIDRDRLTCAGGTAALDMSLTLIRQRQGDALAGEVSEHVVCTRIREAEERQHVPLRNRLGHAPQSLVDAVQLMEANIEEPLSTLELASHLGVSRRQLERLFKKYLQAVPSRYYLELRLKEARRLLRESDRAVGDIALITGFSSGAHFSTAYRNHFGMTPREERLVV